MEAEAKSIGQMKTRGIATAFVLIFMAWIAMGMDFFPAYTAFSGLVKSSGSIPYDITFKLPKALLSILILAMISFRILPQQPKTLNLRRAIVSSSTITILAIVFLLTPAIVFNHVRVDTSAPPESIVWIINNLFFVCFTEEVIYRLFFQNGIKTTLEKINLFQRRRTQLFNPEMLSLVISSLVFGLSHYKKGLTLVALSSIAGLFYGLSFIRGGLLGSTLTHFFVNATHFFLFSYPRLA